MRLPLRHDLRVAGAVTDLTPTPEEIVDIA
jgi:hypothetical protein